METLDNNKFNNRKRIRDEGDEGRCSKQLSKRKYTKKKRTFAGNRYTKNKSSLAAPPKDSCFFKEDKSS